MNITLKTSVISIRPTVVVNPFWFTGDRTIHVSDKKNTVLELDKIPYHNLLQIRNGVVTKMIEVVELNLEQLDEYINKLNSPVEEKPIVIEVPEVTPQVIEQKRDDNFGTEARKILLKTAFEIRKVIGDSELVEGNIPSGIEDIRLLNKLVECETKGRNRKNVLTMLDNRINILKEYGIIVSPDILEPVEEVEDKEITFDSETSTFNEVVK